MTQSTVDAPTRNLLLAVDLGVFVYSPLRTVPEAVVVVVVQPVAFALLTLSSILLWNGRLRYFLNRERSRQRRCVSLAYKYWIGNIKVRADYLKGWFELIILKDRSTGTTSPTGSVLVDWR